MISIPDEIDRLEAIAKAKRWPVAELCGELGIHRATWQRWKNGEHEPKVSFWEQVKLKVAELPTRPRVKRGEAA